MIIVFYDDNAEKLYICNPHERTRVVSVNDPNIADLIPNDDILYVTDGHYFNKKQFCEYLAGEREIEIESEDELPRQGSNRFAGFMDGGPRLSNLPTGKTVQGSTVAHKTGKKRWYLHATGNGVVRIEDIITSKYPEGLSINGKWDFVAIDDIGQEVLDESSFCKLALAKGKIEVVDEDYVKNNAHKKQKKLSPADQATNAILVPTGMSAAEAAAAGGLGGSDEGGAISILVE